MSSPPISHPCFMGVDMARKEELIAANLTVEEIREHIGADSLGYLSLEGLLGAIGRPVGHCKACFDGHYPLPVDEWFDKLAMESQITVPSLLRP